MTKHLSLSDFKGSNIEKAYAANDEFNSQFKGNVIEKSGAHKSHKYLRIENGKYIYDHSKMTAQDHRDEQQFHIERAKHHLDNWERSKQTKKDEHELVKHGKHVDMANEHQKLANEKAKSEKPSLEKIKEVNHNNKIGSYNEEFGPVATPKNLQHWTFGNNATRNTVKHYSDLLNKKGIKHTIHWDMDSSYGKMKNKIHVIEFHSKEDFDRANGDEFENDDQGDSSELSSPSGHEGYAPEIKKSELFDILCSDSESIEKSKGPWKKGKQQQTNHEEIDTPVHNRKDYVKEENDQYTYDHSKMNSRDHHNAADFHRRKASASFDESNRAKTMEERKAFQEKEQYHNKLAREHSNRWADKSFLESEAYAEKHNVPKEKRSPHPFGKMMNNDYGDYPHSNKSDNSDKDNISKAFDLLGFSEDGSDLIEKGAHANHKYLRIENGKYIYDHSKMTYQDHQKASQFHQEKAEQEKYARVANGGRELNKETDKAVKYHSDLAEEHDQLRMEKQHRDHMASRDYDDDPREEENERLASQKKTKEKIISNVKKHLKKNLGESGGNPEFTEKDGILTVTVTPKDQNWLKGFSKLYGKAVVGVGATYMSLKMSEFNSEE